jgi:hypothetical protein
MIDGEIAERVSERRAASQSDTEECRSEQRPFPTARRDSTASAKHKTPLVAGIVRRSV